MSTSNTNQQHTAAVLTGKKDQYNGLILDESSVHPSPALFQKQLSTSLAQWRDEKYCGIWLKLPIDKPHHIGPAVDAGFVYHHAEPEYIMLTQWLPSTENKLPPNAMHHQVGIGAFVFNKQTQSVLVVQEKNGPLKNQGVLKMPTGLVNAGEDITEAAVREVKEETGIDTQFKAVLAMRQAHGLAFGKSDMFFVVALEPISTEQEIVVQEDEIDKAEWISLEHYMSIDFVNSRPVLRKIMETCVAFAQGRYKGYKGSKIASGFSAREDLLLFGEPEEDGDEKAWIGLE